jgi:hypothetical protein
MSFRWASRTEVPIGRELPDATVVVRCARSVRGGQAQIGSYASALGAWLSSVKPAREMPASRYAVSGSARLDLKPKSFSF